MFLVAANTRQAIVGQKEWITTGSSGIQVQFLFSDDWEGLSKFAVFRNAEIEESKIPIALTESNLTELPAENCAAEYVDEKVYVGVYGSDGLGHIIIPTIWVSLGVLKEGAAYEGMDPPQPTPDMWAQILAIAQNAGAENAEEAEKAADEAKTAVTHYPKIVDGYWYVWNAETETWVNTGIKAEGRDGTSPTVTVTDIEGGHRVTITDEDHPQGQTFDVMDGQGGGTGDYDELTNRPRINGHTLTGNQSASDLGLGTYSKPSSGIPKTDLAQDVQASLGKADTALQTAPVQSVAGKTGAVTLGAGDVGFSSSEEYNEGTVGAELSELNRQLNDETTGLDTKAPVIINTASGAIASFSDGADSMPIRKLVAQIEPVQDLHGYDNPWPAGGGKNKFQVTATTQTINGVTFTVNEDGTVLVNGTATDYTGFVLGNASFLTGTESETYILSGCPSGGSSSTYNVDVAGADGYDSGNGVTLRYQPTISNTATRIRVNPGTTVSNLVFKPMIRLASETDATFAPYENLCPISGHTGTEISGTGINIWDEEWENGGINDTTGEPNVSVNSQFRSKRYIPCKANTEYFAYYAGAFAGGLWVYFYDENRNYVGRAVQKNATGYNVTNYVFTTNEETAFMLFKCQPQTGDPAINDKTVSINYPATDTEYHPYTGNQISVNWEDEAGTIYGGSDEVIGGTLIDTHQKQVLDGNRAYSSFSERTNTCRVYLNLRNDMKAYSGSEINIMADSLPVYRPDYVYSNDIEGISQNNNSSQDQSGLWISVLKSRLSSVSLDGVKEYFRNNPCEFLFIRVTPIEYTLTANELTTLYGTNNIWASTGDTEVTYPADTKLYIDNKITQAIANALNS